MLFSFFHCHLTLVNRQNGANQREEPFSPPVDAGRPACLGFSSLFTCNIFVIKVFKLLFTYSFYILCQSILVLDQINVDTCKPCHFSPLVEILSIFLRQLMMMMLSMVRIMRRRRMSTEQFQNLEITHISRARSSFNFSFKFALPLFIHCLFEEAATQDTVKKPFDK